ncbi:MAG: sugar kinase [Sphaerochaetaceae bacterium]|nr:sugar kinase [Sphaerochaetaceae bacterium]
MKRIVTFGEIMLRLKSPHHERFFQSPLFEATYGGGEANVAVSLCLLGEEASFVTALPANAIGDGAISELRRHGVDTSRIVRTKKGRVGIYFLETGANQRPSKVVYDREGSAIASARPDDFNWPALLADASWFHVTGITPALSQDAADSTLAAMQTARRMGLTVSIDLNYRKKLWNYGKQAPEVMGPLAELAQVIVANEEDIQKCLGIESDADVTSGELSESSYAQLATKVRMRYPQVEYVAITLRESISADRNGWRAVLSGKEGFHVSPRFAIDDIIDRVGGGDSFSAGLIYGLRHMKEADALRFAVAASCLKHSIGGDFNLTTLDEVLTLMNGDGSGRVQR